MGHSVLAKLAENGIHVRLSRGRSESSHPRSGQDAAAPWGRRLRKSAYRAANANLLFLLVCLSYVSFVFLLSRAFGFGFLPSLYNVPFLLLGFASLVFATSTICVAGILRYRPEQPLSFARKLLLDDWLFGERLLAALPIILVFPLFISSFTAVKSAIEVFNPYKLDPVFASLDQAIHGGRAAWEFIHPAIGHPAITVVLNFFYNLWFLVMYSILAFVSGWIEKPSVRMQYLVAFLSCWILLGSIAAVGMASGGPCYFGLLYPGRPDPFSPLLAYLRSANRVYPVWALTTQDYLWTLHSTNAPGLGKGISAMPSLHVAIATLNAILGWKISRIAGLAGSAFLVLILLGSVHLGWHYAIDGYFSMIAVPLIWIASGRIVRNGMLGIASKAVHQT